MIDRYSSLFGKYEFVVFQIQIQIIYKICTKVREKIWMFDILFLQSHICLIKTYFLTKSITCDRVEPQVF
jgi:hypothetical protein